MAAGSGFYYDESFASATSASLLSSQFYIVSLSTATVVNGGAPVILTASSTNGPNGAIGVLQNTPTSAGGVAEVRLLGISKVVATTSAAIAQGSLITANASGQACVADTTGQLVIGKAVSGSTGLVANSLVPVLMTGVYSFFA